MSQERPKRLPPLNLQGVVNEGADEDVVTPKKRKKKRTVEDPDGSPQTPGRRARSSSRKHNSTSGTGSGAEGRGVESGERKTPRKTRPRSSSRNGADRTEQTTEQNDVESPVKKPRKKKTAVKKTVGTSRETLMGSDQGIINGNVSQELPPKGKRKKKRKKKGAVSDAEEEVDIGLASYLTGMKDDVVEAESGEDANKDVAWTTPGLRSEPISKVFIERKSGFKSTDKTKLARRQAEQQARAAESQIVQPTQTTIQLALTSHKIFKTFTLFCHGLLAGFALWHIITVFSLSGHEGGFADFLVYYQPLALPVQSLYYVLLVLCTVSVMDRYDVGRPSRRFIIRALTMQSGAVSVLIYVAALVFSLSIAATDDKIGLAKDFPELWENEQARDSELNTWRVVNLCRGVGSILGWIIVSLKPSTDRLTKNLEKADENIIGLSEPVEMIRSNGV